MKVQKNWIFFNWRNVGVKFFFPVTKGKWIRTEEKKVVVKFSLIIVCQNPGSFLLHAR